MLVARLLYMKHFTMSRMHTSCLTPMAAGLAHMVST